MIGDTPNELQITLDHLARLHIACDRFHEVTGVWPSSIQALTNVVRLKDVRILLDGWGRGIVLTTVSNVPQTIWLTSYGADGKLGGMGSNADFTETVY